MIWIVLATLFFGGIFIWAIRESETPEIEDDDDDDVDNDGRSGTIGAGW